ncbi:MAG: hypothetical protein J6U13_03355 [Salinivirgaceae bacterium]|nr:hypothetical protein [Salinivirgaceae bacterium]
MQQAINLYANHKPTDWLPTSVKEMAACGWDQPDVALFSGDAWISTAELKAGTYLVRCETQVRILVKNYRVQ